MFSNFLNLAKKTMGFTKEPIDFSFRTYWYMIWYLGSVDEIRGHIIELIIIVLINVSTPVYPYTCMSLMRHYCSEGSKSNDDPLAINRVIRMSATTKQKAQWMQMETHMGDQLRDRDKDCQPPVAQTLSGTFCQHYRAYKTTNVLRVQHPDVFGLKGSVQPKWWREVAGSWSVFFSPFCIHTVCQFTQKHNTVLVNITFIYVYIMTISFIVIDIFRRYEGFDMGSIIDAHVKPELVCQWHI